MEDSLEGEGRICTSASTVKQNTPTTAQLLETAIRINPFDEKFREANDQRNLKKNKTSSSDNSGILPYVVIDSSGSEDDPKEEGSGSPTKPGLSRKSSGAGSAGLSLKLPPTLTSQSPGLFSNVAMLEDPGGGIDTPEITRLLNQYDGKGRAPKTADVLNAVLDIASPRKFSAPNPQTQREPNEFYVSDANRPQQVSASPPVITSAGFVCEEIEATTADDIPDTVTTTSFPKTQPKEEVVGSAGGPLMLSVRLGGPAGGQVVQIPLELGFLGNPGVAESVLVTSSSGDTNSSRPRSTSAACEPYAAKLEPLPVEDLQGEPEKDVSRMDVKDEELYHGGIGVDGKKKDVMDRNKAAAVRYRKRKKEEFQNLQKKVAKLEEEKLELSTKVHVLQREIDRMAKRLDAHRTCSCSCEDSSAISSFTSEKPCTSTEKLMVIEPNSSTKSMEAKPVVSNNSMNIKQLMGLIPTGTAETRHLSSTASVTPNSLQQGSSVNYGTLLKPIQD